jgi:hypothetical protein
MKYVLLIYGDEKGWADLPPEEQEQLGSEEFKRYGQYSQWLEEKGLYKAGDALHGTEQATTVRVRDGRTVTTDGPFAETKEQLGGYYVIEAENLDQAIDAAARCPGAETGSMEIRPIMDIM